MLKLKIYKGWHIHGLIERDRREFTSALASFKTAERLNSSNMQILTDLSSIQLQQEDFLGHMVFNFK